MTFLRATMPALEVWEYGARLTNFIKTRGSALDNQDELRARSAEIVTPSDINALDDQLLDWTSENRKRTHCVIDSHPVTKESYGYRVTAFSAERFRLLAPDEIWLFYVDPEVTIERIRNDPAGRPMISFEEARIHSASQASVACTFGVVAGCPVYMFDTNIERTKLIEKLRQHLAE